MIEYKSEYPLGPMQKAMLFACVANRNSGVNIEQVEIDFGEKIDCAKLQTSWETVIARHDILRTTLHWRPGKEPYQTVHEQAEAPWQNIDRQNLRAEERESSRLEFLRQDRTAGFDPEQAPLMRFCLFEEPDRHRLIWTFHHMLLDGRSISIVLEEVFIAYLALEQNTQPQFEPPKPYCDYIDWLEKQDETSSRSYWQEFFKDYQPAPPIEIGGPLSENSALEPSDSVLLSLDAGDTSRLEHLAAELGVTLNTIFQAAWALVLSRYTDHEDIVFGAIRACRHWEGKASLNRTGVFINNLPVRVQCDDDQPVSTWLKNLREQHTIIRPYEHTSYEKIESWGKLPQNSNVFETSVMFEIGSFEGRLRQEFPQWPDLQVRIHERSGLPLMISGVRDETLDMELEYDTRRFSRGSAMQILGHMRQTMLNMFENPNGNVGEIQIFDSAEFHQLISGWNQTDTDFPLSNCAHELFEKQALNTPEALAVESAEWSLTYAELNTRSNQFARYLQQQGVKPDTFVGLCVRRSPWMLVGIMGILKAGAAYVPIDPDYPRKRQELIVEDSELAIIVCDEKTEHEVVSTDAQLLAIDRLWTKISVVDNKPLQTTVSPESAAYMIYTSGSTGKPKGVVNLHRGLVNEALGAGKIFPIGPGDRVLQFATISFDAALEEIFGALLSGATLVLRDDAMLATRGAFHDAVRDKKITVLDLPTAFWAQWIQYARQENLELPDSLHSVIVGGEKTSAKAYANWQEVNKGRVRWINTYGPTETAIVSTYYVSPDLPGKVNPIQEVPIGRPIPNCSNHILDSKLRPVPNGVKGELYIGGAGVARGYWNRPELTQEVFVPDPFAEDPKAKMYRTRDLVRRREDGEIEYSGRADTQLKLRGFRIEPLEISYALEQHPDIDEAVVVLHQSTSNLQKLAAYIVPREDKQVTPDDLRNFARDYLPEYMIPQAVIQMQSLPLNENGKVNVKALPPPAEDSETQDTVVLKAENETEEKLQTIFAKVLQKEQIGVTDNFFHLGGDSLLTLQLIEESMKSGIELDPQTIFQNPSVRELASAIFQGKGPAIQSQGPLVTLQANGTRPRLYLVHATPGDVMGYGNLIQHLGNDQPCYGFTSRGLIDKDLCHTSIEDMAAYYNQHLLEFDPDGPYNLGGWCYGGIVAFEMARQLLAQGREVAGLFLIEAVAPPPDGPWGSWRYRFRRLACLLRMSPAKQIAYLRAKLTHQEQYNIDKVAENIALTDSPASLANRLHVYEENVKAYNKYQGQPYDGPMDVFLTEDTHPGVISDPQAAWPLYTANANYHTFPATHEDILKEPSVIPLAKALLESIKV